MVGLEPLEQGRQGRGRGCGTREGGVRTGEEILEHVSGIRGADGGVVRSLKNTDGSELGRGRLHEVARIKAGSANKGKSLSPGGDEVRDYVVWWIMLYNRQFKCRKMSGWGVILTR